MTKTLVFAALAGAALSMITFVLGFGLGRVTAPASEPVAEAPPPTVPVVAAPPPELVPPEDPRVMVLRPRAMTEAARFGSLDGDELTEALEGFYENTEVVEYAQLQRNSDPYVGSQVMYRGQVLEITDDPQGGSTLLVGVRRRWGGWSDPIRVHSVRRPDEFVVARTVVRVYGYVTGETEYEARPGWTITVPEMIAVAVVDNASVPPHLSRAARARLDAARAEPQP